MLPTLLILILACAGAITGPNPEFELGVGEAVVLSDLGVEVTFQGVTADSRCPVDVQCVWAGDATALLIIRTPDGKDSLSLHTGTYSSRATQAGLVFTLLELSPSPNSQEELPPSDYRIRLKAETE